MHFTQSLQGHTRLLLRRRAGSLWVRAECICFMPVWGVRVLIFSYLLSTPVFGCNPIFFTEPGYGK